MSHFFLLSVVEFRTEELMKKAVEKVNKHMLNGRPLKVKEVEHTAHSTAQKDALILLLTLNNSVLSGSW